MHAVHPEMASRWEKETPKGAELPEHTEQKNEKHRKHAAFMGGFLDEIVKIAKEKERKMPSFLKQERPEGVKHIYRAMTRRSENMRELKKRYGSRAKEVAARVAARQGKRGKQHQGPPYKEPI
jgi:hypothetical protein